MVFQRLCSLCQLFALLHQPQRVDILIADLLEETSSVGLRRQKNSVACVNHFSWVKDHNNQYPTERIEAREAFREAMAVSFNGCFGMDVNDEKALHG